VIGPDAGLCDALATALMVAGKDGVKWFGLPELASYSAWVVNRNENTAWSVND
jgi:thiamine biosynthesis lipoprotein